MFQPIEIQISADPTQAEAGLKKIGKAMSALDTATGNYKRELAEVSRAEATGLVSKQRASAAAEELAREYVQAASQAAKFAGASVQVANAVDEAGRSYVNAAGQANVYANASKSAAASTTNLMFQFQDIGMMLAAGQNPLMLAMQQGTQVAGVFHQMQGAGQSAMSGIMGALRSLVSPMSLLTVGAIAGGAALVQWGMSALGAGEDARTLEDAMDDLNDIASQMDNSLAILQMSAFDMAEQYGTLAGRVRELAQEELRLAEIRARQAIQDEIASIGDLDRAYQGALRSGQDYRNAMRRIQRDFGVAENAAVQLAGALNRVSSANTPDQYVDAMIDLRRILDENNVELAEIPIELQEAIARANGLEMAMINVAAAASNAASEAGNLAAALAMTSGVGLSGDAASFLPTESELGTREPSGGGGGGGGGGARSGISALAESLATEAELLEQWRADSLAELANFNAEELELLGGHNEARLRLEQEYQDRVRELQQNERQAMRRDLSSFFGEVSSLMESENRALFNIGKAAAIANAVIAAEESIVNAYNFGTRIGGPALGATFAGVAGLAQAARIQKIASTQFGGSGGAASVAASGNQGAQSRGPTQNIVIDIVNGTSQQVSQFQSFADTVSEASRRGEVNILVGPA